MAEPTDRALTADAPAVDDRGGDDRAESAARSTLGALWFVVTPALLALTAVRRLVPAIAPPGSAVAGDAIRAAQTHPAMLGAALFLLFAGAARYWRFVLPGGRHLSPFARSAGRGLDAAGLRRHAEAATLAASLRRGRMRRRLERRLTRDELAELDARLDELRGALAAGDEVRIETSAQAAAAVAAPVRRGQSLRDLAGVVVGVALAMALAFGVRSRLVESYSVLSGSMLPTLQPEDRLAGNRLAYRGWTTPAAARCPRRGDIIVFQSSAVDGGDLTDVPDFLVKRVIGLPGDRIGMKGGIPVINGWTVPVCDAGEYLYVLEGGENGLDGRLAVEFLEDRAYLTVHAVGSAAFEGTYAVAPGEVFVLGDNRNNSIDSRAYNEHHGGGVPLSAIEARVDWFVAGRRFDTQWDLTRLFRRLDSMATTLHLDGVDQRPLQAGIAKCLAQRPATTSPPPASGAPAPTPPAPGATP